MKQLETDVVVVAAGLSGLAAAVAAAEAGARVIALEKAPITGGAANMGMGPAAAGSPLSGVKTCSRLPFRAWTATASTCATRSAAATPR